jgi:hypothetical protein
MPNVYTLDTSLARETAAGLDTFTRAYVEALFWLLTDESGDSLDYLGLHDLAPEALAEIREDCRAFQRDHADLLAGADLSRAGHDFYLTRNGHGAGFWDRDPATYPADPDGRLLTAAADAYGPTSDYVGDDGMVYSD